MFVGDCQDRIAGGFDFFAAGLSPVFCERSAWVMQELGRAKIKTNKKEFHLYSLF